MGLIGILLGLALLIWLALRGWSVLLLAPPPRCSPPHSRASRCWRSWTQTFMFSAATFLAQFFPLFLLGALFGKLMDDSGSVSAIADFLRERLGERRAIMAVVLAGASSPMAASACSLRSSCSSPWRRRCFAPPPFRAG